MHYDNFSRYTGQMQQIPFLGDSKLLETIWEATMNTFLNFETYIPLTDFEILTIIKCEDEREFSSLTKSEKP